MSRLMSAKEVAEHLGVTRDWVYSHRDEIGWTEVGGCIRFRQNDLDRYLDARTHHARVRAGRPRKQQRRIVRKIEWPH